MYCYNLYSLLRPFNNLSLRVEGRGKLEDCFGGGTKGDQSSVTEYKGRTVQNWLQMWGSPEYCRAGGGVQVGFTPPPLVTQGDKLRLVPYLIFWHARFLDIKNYTWIWRPVLCLFFNTKWLLHNITKVARHTVTPKYLRGYPSSNYRYIVLHYYSIHSTFYSQRKQHYQKKWHDLCSVECSCTC